MWYNVLSCSIKYLIYGRLPITISSNVAYVNQSTILHLRGIPEGAYYDWELFTYLVTLSGSLSSDELNDVCMMRCARASWLLSLFIFMLNSVIRV